MKLSDLAYYRTGGSCLELYEPKNIDELSSIVKDLNSRRLPYFVLGGGTNSLVLDDMWPGAVICFTQMKRIEVDLSASTLRCEAGVENSSIAGTALKEGLGGVSWMMRLPGQIGGTVRMNARCYGGEISQVVSEVEAVMPDGRLQRFKGDAQVFSGYKDTVFMKNGAIIARVSLQLRAGNRESLAAHMNFCESDRIAKGQFLHPTCGCVFKNDYRVGVPSGMLLDKAGAHGLNRGKTMINPKHANFVYNLGASSRDILELTLDMRELVYQTYGVWLAYEMEILGELPPDLQQRVAEERPQRLREDRLEPLRQLFQKRPQP